MINLFEEYPAEALASKGVNLFDEYNENNMQGTPKQALELAKKQISAKYPNMPDFVRDAILKITPQEPSPMLDSAAQGITDVTNYIPASLGGALEGASIPIRGVASMIPTEFTQKLANSPDLRDLFPQAEGTGQKSVQMASELFGSGGLFGKMLGGAKTVAELARIPAVLRTPAALVSTGIVATPGDILEKLMGGTGALALGGAGKIAGKVGEKVPKFLRGLFSESTPEALVSSVQKPHDILERSADELYGQVESAINKRNIKIPIKEQYLDQASEYFPKNTRSYKDLIDRAKKGDYEAIHKIQSSLYKKGTKALASDDLAVENQGEDILDLRDKINDDSSSYLIKEGHLDVAHVLSQAKKIYSQVMRTYYPKNLRSAIGKMVNSELRLVPDNPQRIFKQNSVPMKRFLEDHPEAAKHVKELAEKEAASKLLKKILYTSGGTGAGIAGGKAIYDLFK